MSFDDIPSPFNSPFPLSNSPLATALSNAVFRLSTAYKPEDIFSSVAEEVQRYGYSCVLFLLDRSQRRISPTFISKNIKEIHQIEQFVNLEHTDYSIPLDSSPHFLKVIQTRSPLLIQDTGEVVRDWLPDSLKPLASQITRMLNIPISIISPFMVEGETLGIFAIASPTLHEEEFPLVLSFSNLMAAGWKRAELYAQALNEIEHRKKLEQALELSEQRYRVLVDFSPDGVLVVKEGKIVFINQAISALLGSIEPSDILGISVQTLTSSGWSGLSIERLVEIVQTTSEPAPTLESKITRFDGTPLNVELIAVPVQYDGEPAVQIVLHDITDRRRLEASLRESEDKYRLLTDSSITGVYLIQDGLFRYVNHALASIFGYQVDELINRLGPMDLTYPDDRSLVSENIRLRVDNFIEDIRYTFRGLRKDGQVIHVEVHGRRIEYGGKVGVIGTLIDITERFRQEAALRETERFLRTIVEQVPAVIYTEDATDGHLLYISPQVEYLSGYSVSEWISRTDFWKDIIHPEDRERVIALDEETNQSGSSFVIDYRMMRRDGHVIWVHDEAVLIKDETDQPLYWQGIMLDITDQKHHEQEIEALGKLAHLSVETAELRPLLDGVLQAAIQAIDPAEKGSILLLNEVGELAIKAIAGYSDPRILTASFPLHHGYSAHCVRERRSLIIPDARGNAEYRYDGEIDEMTSVQSAIVSPLIARGVLIGVISLDNVSRKNAFSDYDLQILENLAATAALLIERSKLLEELQRYIEHQTALNAILLAASRTNDIQTILDIVLDHLLLALRMKIGAIWISIPSGAQHLVAMRDLPPGLSDQMDDLAAQRFIDLPNMQVIEDTEKHSDPHLPPLLRKFGIRAGVAAPLIVDGQRIGGIAIAEGNPRSWTVDELRLIETLGHQVGVLIQRGHLFEQLQKHIDRLETVYRVSTELRVAHGVEEALPILLEQTRLALKAEGGCILLYDIDNKRYYPKTSQGWLTESLAQVVDGIEIQIETREIIFSENFFFEPRLNLPPIVQMPNSPGGAIVPFFVHSQPVGVMLLSLTDRNVIDSQTIALLESIADIASSALQRIRLYDSTLAQVKKLNALREIDRLIASGFELSVIFDAILLHVLHILQVDAASILTFDTLTKRLERVALKGLRNVPLYKTHLSLMESLAAEAIIKREPKIISNLSVYSAANEQLEILLEEGLIAYCAQPFESKGQIKGVLEIASHTPLILTAEWKEFLEAIAQQLVIAMENAHLIQDLHRSNAELIAAYDATIEGWSKALDLRDKETEGHTQRVTEMVLQLALVVGIKPDDLVHLRRGAILHDIGKMGIPDSILLKPGSLTEDEWTIMRKHPEYAYDLLSPIEYLRPALDIPYCHHEKWDGSGYPRGLKGEQIPLAARLFAVVDVYDALTSDRPYRRAWTKNKALHYIQEQSAKHFDPQIAQIFLTILDDVR